MLSGQPEVAGAAEVPPASLSLEERLEMLEQGTACGRDFDSRSALWLLLLGVVMPVLMLVAGWVLA